jgi:hypothetical protein
MQLYYFQDPDKNFGDDLNPWFWNSLLTNPFDDNSDEILIGIGTLLNYKIPDVKSVSVLGAGVGYGDLPYNYKNFNYCFVRGPLSAKKLDLDISKAITDPAILISELHPVNIIKKKYPVSFMPHCDSDSYGDWEEVCRLANIHYISPRQSYLTVFEEIANSEKLITEAMHGTIIADSYRVPFYPVKCYEHISDFKWQDWALSMELDFSLFAVNPVWRGDVNLPFKKTLKNNIKRILLAINIWKDSWDKALPKKSTNKKLRMVSNELKSLLNKEYYLSKDEVFSTRKQQVKAVIAEFNSKHNNDEMI